MSDTSTKLLDLAEALMRDVGYGGFSFRDLAAEVGIRSASVHHHFSTKAGLVAAVVRRYAERFFRRVAKVSGERPGDVVERYRSALREESEQAGRMCLPGVLGAEAGGLRPEVVDEVEIFFRRCIDDLSSRIGGSDAVSCAYHVMAALEGGLILARANGAIIAYDNATAGLLGPVAASSMGVSPGAGFV